MIRRKQDKCFNSCTILYSSFICFWWSVRVVSVSWTERLLSVHFWTWDLFFPKRVPWIYAKIYKYSLQEFQILRFWWFCKQRLECLWDFYPTRMRKKKYSLEKLYKKNFFNKDPDETYFFSLDLAKKRVWFYRISDGKLVICRQQKGRVQKQKSLKILLV